MTLAFNKVCELEDFSDPDLSGFIGDVFRSNGARPLDDAADSKEWEIAMSCRALDAFGALNRSAVVLGVGAGTEATSFYLTRRVKQVVATDLYLHPGLWADVAPPLMLVDPERFAPFPFEPERLVVQHMDGRRLRYPDDTFDGIFSSGSIEHFGSLEFIANAAFEMGRVAKPGGIVTLATEFKIAGPPGEDGWEHGTFVLSKERIARYIVEASGLEQVDSLNTSLSAATLQSRRNLATFLANTSGPMTPEIRAANYPNVVLVHEGYVFCSVHLALRKTRAYPVTDNDWARPSKTTERAIAADVQRLERALIEQRAPDRATVDAAPHPPPTRRAMMRAAMLHPRAAARAAAVRLRSSIRRSNRVR